MQVKVYRNVQKQCYSIQGKYSTVAVEHADVVSLLNAHFVEPSTVKQKTLPAYVLGERLYSNKPGVFDNTFTQIYYNPNKFSYFYTDTNAKVTSCDMLVMTPAGMFAKGIRTA